MSVHEKLTAIAEGIRTITGSTEKLGLDAMAEGVTQVYHQGFSEGKLVGADAMWDTIQDYGNRTAYTSAFRNWGATHITPKYPIKTHTLYEIFNECQKLEAVPTVISANADGKFQSCYSAFAYCAKLKSIDFDIYCNNKAAAAWQATFNCCYELTSIQTLGVLASNGFTNTFRNCYALEEVRFDGEIGQSGLNLQWSTKLSKESIESIIGCLSDTTEGLSITLSETAVNQSFGYEEILDDSPSWVDGIYSDEWIALVDSKPNWTISLV